MNRILQFDSVELNPSKITNYEHDVFGPTTVFHDVVIARTIVQDYEDGKAYKPADELEKASWTAEGRWIILGRHPDTTIISSRNDISGRTVNVRFTKSLKNSKTKRPEDRGILADLEVFDNKISPEDLSDMKNGRKSDVSIGFFFDQDVTPGVIGDDYPQLKGVEYDYVQRNIMIDHTAAALETGVGRCTMPACGIGADEIVKQVTGDPFGEYKDFKDCVAKNRDKNDPEAYCASIERKIKEARKKKRDAPRTEAERAMAHFNISEEEWEQLSDEAKQKYIDKLPSRGTAGMKDKIEELKETINQMIAELDDLVEEEYQGNATNTTLSERAKKFFNLSDEQWNELTEAEKEDRISRLPPEKVIEGAEKDTWSISKDEFHELPLERKIAFLDFVACDDCLDGWEIDQDAIRAEAEKPEEKPDTDKAEPKKSAPLPSTDEVLRDTERVLKDIERIVK